jgi:hypothetical protein
VRGIAGILIRCGDELADPKLVDRMREPRAHRGLGDHGLYASGPVALGGDRKPMRRSRCIREGDPLSGRTEQGDQLLRRNRAASHRRHELGGHALPVAQHLLRGESRESDRFPRPSLRRHRGERPTFPYLEYEIRFPTPERKAELVQTVEDDGAYLVGDFSATLQSKGCMATTAFANGRREPGV